ncbi:MAG TPA: molybdopterin molybdenumtransferase MoeA, partial [Novosphingobium sp.]|nr:molybdopterin molybdenumtransferase MoeA [Novosphingobium sp.]
MKSAPLPLEDAQARLLALASPLPVEHLDIASRAGGFWAEPPHARRTQPARDLSAMDGYAVAAGDLAGPWQVIGESAAGHPFAGTLQPGQAVRVATGAVMPDAGEAVILQEDVTRDGLRLTLTGTPPAPPGKH